MTGAIEDPRADGQEPPRRSAVKRSREAIDYCLVPARLRRTVMITLVVGTILTLLNQGDVILAGAASTATVVKAGLNYVVPFIVSNLGLLSGRNGRG